MTTDSQRARQLALVGALLVLLAALTAFSIWGSWPSSSTSTAAPLNTTSTVTQTRKAGEHE